MLLTAGTGIDLKGWNSGMSAIRRDYDKFQREIDQRPFKMPEMSSSLASGGSSTSSFQPTEASTGLQDLGSTLIPLAQQIKTAITNATAPLNSFAVRFGAQFDAVGGTIIALARRIDEHLKFPAFEKGIDKARGFIKKTFVDAEGQVTRFGKRADGVLAGLGMANKFKNFVSNFGDIGKKGVAEFGKIKAPKLNFDQSVTSITNINQAAKAAGQSVKGMFGQFALAVGAVGLTYKAVDALKDGIKGAMDLGETLSKVKTVFGGTSAAVIGNADKMAQSFGLPKQAILDASASFGLIGKAAGYNGQQTAALATDMSKLAADVSSFYNIPLDEALNKLRSGLVGEAEPMRSLGVLLSETAVKQEAYRLGIVKAGEDLSEQQKVTARSSLITKGLADATGDLERTQDSSSNQARKFAGSMSNLAVSVGELLLPALNKGLGLLNEFETFLQTSFEASKSTIAGWGEAIGGVFDTVGIIFRNWEDTVAIMGLGVYETIANLGNQFDAFGQNTVNIGKWVGENWFNFIKDALNGSLTLLDNFAKNWQAVGGAIFEFIKDPSKGFKVDWVPMLDGFQSSLTELPKMMDAAIVDMSDEMAKHQQNIIDNEAKRQAKMPNRMAEAKKGVVNNNPLEDMSAKAMEKLGDFAKKFKEKTATAYEEYDKAIAESRKALEQGLITPEEFKRADLFARKESGLDKVDRFSGAQEFGSKEAYNTIINATTGKVSGFKNLEKIGQQGNAIMAGIAKDIGTVAKAAVKAPAPAMGLGG